jgi:hypothetical protein
VSVPELAGEAMVDRVVPVAWGGAFMAATLGNDPAPQRHWHAHAPFAWMVPVPEARAPGEPTARAAEAWTC